MGSKQAVDQHAASLNKWAEPGELRDFHYTYFKNGAWHYNNVKADKTLNEIKQEELDTGSEKVRFASSAEQAIADRDKMNSELGKSEPVDTTDPEAIQSDLWYTFFKNDLWHANNVKNTSKNKARADEVAAGGTQISFWGNESLAKEQRDILNAKIQKGESDATREENIDVISEMWEKARAERERLKAESKLYYDQAKESIETSKNEALESINDKYQTAIDLMLQDKTLASNTKDKLVELLNTQKENSIRLIEDKADLISQSSALKYEAVQSAKAWENSRAMNILQQRGISDPNMLSRMAWAADAKAKIELDKVKAEELTLLQAVKDKELTLEKEVLASASGIEREALVNALNIWKNIQTTLKEQWVKESGIETTAGVNQANIEKQQAADAAADATTELQNAINLENAPVQTVLDLQKAQWEQYITSGQPLWKQPIATSPLLKSPKPIGESSVEPGSTTVNVPVPTGGAVTPEYCGLVQGQRKCFNTHAELREAQRESVTSKYRTTL